MPRPELYGHRGAAGEAPENTVEGLQHLLASGAHRVEIDLRLSGDGEVVVVHDETLKRMTGHPGRVRCLSAAALGQLNPAVPTLESLIRAGTAISHWQLEIKPLSAADRRHLIRRLAAILRRCGPPLDRFSATSSSPPVLAELTSGFPGLRRGVVIDRPSDFAHLARFQSRLAVVNLKLLSRWRVRELQRRGVAVSVWTIRSWDEYEQARRLGVDSVIVDYPKALGLRIGATDSSEA